jgi:conjugative relaxase-like TrwC/TraI family protein
MMTAASIPAENVAGYADYLDSKTVAPEQGDYYLGRDGMPAEAPGRWIGDPDALTRVGITPGPVDPDELRAMMEGRRPGEGEPVWLRNAGPDGTRAGGLDITFSAPKGVSVAWALGTDRAGIEAAHEQAVDAALDHLRRTVELTVRCDPAAGTVPDTAAHLHAAGFTHTTARGVGDAVPDPQLHTHVVITSVERHDGSTAAVRSRPAFRAAREVGAYYRAHLADGLRALGYQIDPAGDDGRYFSIRGIPQEVEQAFSKRAEEVTRAARAFRARYGREPIRGELRDMATKTRSRKQPLPTDRGELDRAWEQTGREAGAARAMIDHARTVTAQATDREAWAQRVEHAASAQRAIFTERELRTAALEHAPGTGLAPAEALAATDSLRRAGRVLDLDDGRMTTRRVREAERAIERRMRAMANDPTPALDAHAREHGIATVERRLGGELSAEQRAAVETITGPGRASVLIGPAGTGKGVVIDAAAHAEVEAGREVYGVAVAGRTAQRLGAMVRKGSRVRVPRRALGDLPRRRWFRRSSGSGCVRQLAHAVERMAADVGRHRVRLTLATMRAPLHEHRRRAEQAVDPIQHRIVPTRDQQDLVLGGHNHDGLALAMQRLPGGLVGPLLITRKERDVIRIAEVVVRKRGAREQLVHLVLNLGHRVDSHSRTISAHDSRHATFSSPT